MKEITDSFYGNELGVPLLLLFSSRSDRLAPYCFYTFLAGTHNYLAGIHNYVFTIRATTMVHHRCLWEDGIALSPSSFQVFCQHSCPIRPPQYFDYAEPGLPHTQSSQEILVVTALFAFCFSFVRMIVPWVFLTLPACSLI